MKIVSWNCNLNLAKKFVHLEAIDADIFIIQECEKLKEDYFPNAKFFWTGRIENKGLGIIIKNKSALLDPIHNPNFINFLPIRSDEIKIMGVWAYNHRAVKFGDNVSGKTIEAINHYKNWLVEDQMPSVFAGDFNNSVIWDKSKNDNNFQNINKKLESFGFLSTYHSLTGDVFGDEDKPTFFHTKNILKQYHIDYIYLKSSEATSVKVGEYHDWIKLSDHVPIITEITN
jgi:exonuclease III